MKIQFTMTWKKEGTLTYRGLEAQKTHLQVKKI